MTQAAGMALLDFWNEPNREAQAKNSTRSDFGG
jgi:hypothetical protein